MTTIAAPIQTSVNFDVLLMLINSKVVERIVPRYD
jgi:hypothetical protein